MDLKSCSPDLYKIWKIPKIKDGKLRGWRTIEEPCEELKKVQHQILDVLNIFPFLSCVYGVKGTSAIENAAVHQGQKIIVKLDIKDFFPSTTLKLVEQQPFPPELVDFLVERKLNYCFIKENNKTRLPQGAPTSPALASIAMTQRDIALLKLAEKYGLTYTRYVDDLTFSGSYRPRNFVQEVSLYLKPAYRLNWEKVESAHHGYQRQEVTGVVINQKLSVPRTVRHNLRAQLDRLAREGKSIDEETSGLLSYIRSVNKDQYHALFDHYARRCEFYGAKAISSNPSSEQGISAYPTNNS